MTIRNYTFFSPNGTEFPVSANADAKLYMMMAGNDYSQFMIRHWSEPTLTGLNKVYSDTSILLGGRYFELNNEPVVLNANTVNYIHANIDPSNVTEPVTLSVETSTNSNSNDINSGNGVIKRLVDIVTTDATKVIKSETPEQSRGFENVNVSGNVSTKGSVTAKRIASIGDVPKTPLAMSSGWTANHAFYAIKNGVLYINIYGARPTSNLTGVDYPQVTRLPNDIAKQVTQNSAFRWSNYTGSSTTYAGVLEGSNGTVRMYLAPKSNTLTSGHRYSVYLAVYLDNPS